MLGSHTARSFVPRHHDIFIGLDVDKASISLTCLDHEQMIKSLRMPYQAAGLLKFVERQFPGMQVAFVYEAGPTGFGLHDDLTHAGYPCLVVSPSMVPQAAGNRIKTNRLDSQRLAESLRGGQLKGIHVPSEPYRQLRHLT